MNRADGRWAAGLFVCLVLFYACFRQTRDWNTASRFLLTYSLVQEHSVEVTPFVTRGGFVLRDPPTRDLSSPDKQRFFCDKAPGQSILGAVVYAPIHAAKLLREYPRTDGPQMVRVEALALWPADWPITVLTSGFVTAGTAVLLFLMLRRWEVAPQIAMATALAFGFATPALAYATLFYGHALAGFFILLTLFLIDGAGQVQRGRTAMWFAAGLSAGAAVATEYTAAALVVAVMVVGFIAGFGRRAVLGSAAGFLTGGAVIAGLLGWYHYLVTGDPLVPPYRNEVLKEFADVHARGAGIPVSLPSADAVAGLLWGSPRGLLLFAPVAVFALVGIPILWRKRPTVAAQITLTSVGLLAIVAGFPFWDGGLATGPRFLVPIIPILMLGVGVALESLKHGMYRLLFAVLACWGGILNIAMTTCGARASGDISWTEFIQSTTEDPMRPMQVLEGLLVQQHRLLPEIALLLPMAVAAVLACVMMRAAGNAR